MQAADITATTMTTTLSDGELLRLTWLASPALPVGGFSYSEGMEAAVEAGLVRDEESAGDWLVDQLLVSLARGDLAVVAAVANEPSRAGELDDWVRQTRETSEFRLQSEQMGRSLAIVDGGVAARTHPTAAGTYPVAFALAANGAPVRATLLAYAFGWSENMMQAAIKSVPLGQSAGQRILARLANEIPQAVEYALHNAPQAFTPMLAILSSRHETQYSRLFRS